MRVLLITRYMAPVLGVRRANADMARVYHSSRDRASSTVYARPSSDRLTTFRPRCHLTIFVVNGIVGCSVPQASLPVQRDRAVIPVLANP